MANGDAAADAGMDVVPGTADLRKGYDEDNKTRDYIAAEMTARAAADGNKLDKDKLRIQLADPGDVPDGVVWISWVP